MNIPYIRAPHNEGASSSAVPSAAPNAALLIDFDNVTMGMRSDLSKELKNLLRSDVIRGKVTVQRAYADWRRYPQYIVPLSEASIDLIFAPAYGSSKKNATDIRMAIDGMELVFTRPEIGTYILLTGDSDFSSLVLKLKEYGKYVIGVGIQESSSDILVQNCDEYYSYTSLTGLRKSGSGGDRTGLDPWMLVEKAVERMKRRNDVMRSDRLKQVMLELDASFDEKSLGFSKFSRFLTEAAQKGLLKLRKLDNGQYEISDGSGGSAGGSDRAKSSSDGSGSSRGGQGRDDRRSRSTRDRGNGRGRGSSSDRTDEGATPTTDRSLLQPAYDLMVEAISDLLEDHEGEAIRDSDVKRRMLAIRNNWDESEFGFPKFSKFLKQAHDHEVIDLRKGPNGNYEVALGANAGIDSDDGAPAEPDDSSDRGAAAGQAPRSPDAKKRSEPPSSAGREVSEKRVAGRLRPRTSRARHGQPDEPPPLFEGQTVGGSKPSAPASSGPASTGPASAGPASSGSIESDIRTSGPVTTGESREVADGPDVDREAVDVQALRLPTGRSSVVKYLANSYRGVGKKTAESLWDELGDDLFPTLESDPDRVRDILTPARAEKVLEAWSADFERRGARTDDSTAGRDAHGNGSESGGESDAGDRGRRRGGRRTRTRSSR